MPALPEGDGLVAAEHEAASTTDVKASERKTTQRIVLLMTVTTRDCVVWLAGVLET
jgi:hypothetical protein